MEEINVDHPKELTHISLCAGYGGIDLGLRRALGAVRTIAFSEIEAYPCENLVAKMEAGWLDAAPIWTDLKTFPWERFRDKVDILSGGFPCQPFSAAGRRAGDDDPRHLWPSIVRGIRELAHPPVVFFENVEGIISSKLTSDGWADPTGTSVLLHVLRELERLGYQATAGVFSAREVGAPHQRKRVFIMGVRSDLSDTGRALVSELLSATDLADSSTIYPAPRGAEQYEWEPPRVTMGNAMRWDAQNCISLKESSCQSTRDGETNLLEHASSNHDELGNPQQQRPQGATDEGWEPPSERLRRSATRSSSTNKLTQSLGHPDSERSQGALLSGRSRESIKANSSIFTRPSSRRSLYRQTKPTMGGEADGAPCWMDYAQLCHAVDNRTDELRLLGNGVVPATAERAFRRLWSEIKERPSWSSP